MAPLSNSDVRQIADAVVEKIGVSVIPSSLPAHIGQMLRETAKYGAYQYVYMLPGGGPYALSVQFVVNPDGTLNMELRDPSGCAFWRGTFRPEAPDGPAAAR